MHLFIYFLRLEISFWKKLVWLKLVQHGPLCCNAPYCSELGPYKHAIFNQEVICKCACVSVWVYVHEWKLRNRLWLDWCPSPDESQILMCQQGWIMHTAPLPRFSSSPSPPLIFSRSSLFSSELPHLKTSSPFFFLPPLYSPLPVLCKRGHHFLISAASLSSGQPFTLPCTPLFSAAISFFPWPLICCRGWFSFIWSVDVFARFSGDTTNTFCELGYLLCWWLHCRRLNVYMYYSLSNHGRRKCSHWLSLTVTFLTDRSH